MIFQKHLEKQKTFRKHLQVILNFVEVEVSNLQGS